MNVLEFQVFYTHYPVITVCNAGWYTAALHTSLSNGLLTTVLSSFANDLTEAKSPRSSSRTLKLKREEIERIMMKITEKNNVSCCSEYQYLSPKYVIQCPMSYVINLSLSNPSSSAT
jgi:hypothetical protein